MSVFIMMMLIIRDEFIMNFQKEIREILKLLCLNMCTYMRLYLYMCIYMHVCLYLHVYID